MYVCKHLYNVKNLIGHCNTTNNYKHVHIKINRKSFFTSLGRKTLNFLKKILLKGWFNTQYTVYPNHCMVAWDYQISSGLQNTICWPSWFKPGKRSSRLEVLNSVSKKSWSTISNVALTSIRSSSVTTTEPQLSETSWSTTVSVEWPFQKPDCCFDMSLHIC